MNYDPGLYCPDHRKWGYHYHRTAADERHQVAVRKGWEMVACQVVVIICWGVLLLA